MAQFRNGQLAEWDATGDLAPSRSRIASGNARLRINGPTSSTVARYLHGDPSILTAHST